MRIRLTTLIAVLLLSIGTALAQTQVNGVVLSAEDNTPLVGASVEVDGTERHTSTTADGKFTITAPNGATLKISYIGMRTKKVKAAVNLIVLLESNQQEVEEVVVIGYGSARKIGSVTGNITTVSADKIKNAPSSSALDALQGQVAGLNVLTSSGEAGDNAVSMNIHGIGSLGAGSSPLYVIDGIPSSSRTIMALNPNDIKSISVLKDASATSIYGARAANGVIYVTTKGGAYNQKAKITVRSQYGISTFADDRLLDNILTGDELKDFWISSGLYTQENFDRQYTAKGFDANTRWADYFMQFNNPQYQNDITVEGGSETVAYMIGASQFHQRGTAIGNYFDRYTFRSNIDAKPKDWLRMGVNLNLSYDKRQRNADWGNSSSGNANYTSGGLSFLLNPLYPAGDSTGVYQERFTPGLGNWNPRYSTANQPDVYQRYGIVGTAYIEIEPLKNLKIRSRIGSDMYFIRDNWSTNPSYKAVAGKGQRGKSMDFGYSNTITNTIEYSFKINEDHKFVALLGQEGIHNSYDYFYASSSGQVYDELLNLQNGLKDTYAMEESWSASKFLSFFGRLDYSYADRYFIDVTLRNDASSRFGKNNRNATFWAAGAMWKMKKEKFMENLYSLNDLDLKLSYGTQGNASIGDYISLGKIGTLTKYNTGTPLYFSGPVNSDLTWEEQSLFTLTLAGRAFKKLDFELSYYIRTTSNMLMDVPYAYTAGFTALTENVGSLQNKGIDVKLGYMFLQGKDYYLRAGINFNYNASKITKLFQGRQRWEIANTGVAYVVGKPVMFYYPIFAGIDPADGAPLWYKAGENPDVTTKNETTRDFNEAALTQNTGIRRHAPFNGGFNIAAGWKGITFAADFTVVLGKYLINNDKYFYTNPSSFLGYNTHRMVLDYWTPEHTDAAFPDWNNYTMQFDTNLIENASFLRLKNLQLGYELPQSLLTRQNVVSNVKFTLTGRNLFTVTKYTGWDPEVDSNLTLGKMGNSKQVLFGIEIGF